MMSIPNTDAQQPTMMLEAQRGTNITSIPVTPPRQVTLSRKGRGTRAGETPRNDSELSYVLDFTNLENSRCGSNYHIIAKVLFAFMKYPSLFRGQQPNALQRPFGTVCLCDQNARTIKMNIYFNNNLQNGGSEELSDMWERLLECPNKTVRINYVELSQTATTPKKANEEKENISWFDVNSKHLIATECTRVTILKKDAEPATLYPSLFRDLPKFRNVFWGRIDAIRPSRVSTFIDYTITIPKVDHPSTLRVYDNVCDPHLLHLDAVEGYFFNFRYHKDTDPDGHPLIVPGSFSTFVRGGNDAASTITAPLPTESIGKRLPVSWFDEDSNTSAMIPPTPKDTAAEQQPQPNVTNVDEELPAGQPPLNDLLNTVKDAEHGTANINEIKETTDTDENNCATKKKHRTQH